MSQAELFPEESKAFTPVLGGSYITRDGRYVVRVISLIGTWHKGHPVVGEMCELKGKKKTPSEGIAVEYEHWTKGGCYLDKASKSHLDLVKEYVP